MNITIVGAGNVGIQFAVHCAGKWHNVIIYGSKPEKVNKALTIINENDEIIHQGTVTDDDAELASYREEKYYLICAKSSI